MGFVLRGNKGMKLFSNIHVSRFWEDKLENKEGFMACDISSLHYAVEYQEPRKLKKTEGMLYYYDPYWSFKKAFQEGKTVQWKSRRDGEWYDIVSETDMLCACLGDTLRIKP